MIDRKGIVLYAEDNESDQLIFSKLWKKVADDEVRFANDGQELMDILVGMVEGDKVFPYFILLDLNMPGKSGYDVLKEIKQHPVLGLIPVIIYSSSTRQEDVDWCFEHQANGYIHKNIGADGLAGLKENLRRLHDFWRNVSALPEEIPE